MNKTWSMVGLLALLAGARAGDARAQGGARVPVDAVPVGGAGAAEAVPFRVGEVAQYDVKFGVISAGSATISVSGLETIRGRPAWHTAFRIRGGIPLFRVDDVLESWIDTATFSSLRFSQRQKEGPKSRRKLYEIYPDRAMYVELDKQPAREHAGVKDPLDDGSFLFFIRTIQLEIGKTYSSDRYFRPERNPVRIQVLRKETIEVPAGKFNCVVIRPVIKTEGIFSENGQAEVWVTDDARRVVVQLKSRMSFGSINLYLKSYKAGA